MKMAGAILMPMVANKHYHHGTALCSRHPQPGPSYWGLMNSDWFLCDKGRRQSPIDVNTKALVYDPHLTPLRADNNLVSVFPAVPACPNGIQHASRSKSWDMPIRWRKT
jgi:carbonic anhydrase